MSVHENTLHKTIRVTTEKNKDFFSYELVPFAELKLYVQIPIPHGLKGN